MKFVQRGKEHKLQNGWVMTITNEEMGDTKGPWTKEEKSAERNCMLRRTGCKEERGAERKDKCKNI